MLYSMTGFGREEAPIAGRQVSVEIKALNGKQFDISTKIPHLLRIYELDVRSMLSGMLFRGTTEIIISIKQDGISKPMAVNVSLAVSYYQSMQEIARRLSIPEEQMLPTIMRMPEVVAPEQDVLPESDWLKIRELIKGAAAKLMAHRHDEGKSLEKDLKERIAQIEGLLEKIMILEPQRMERVRIRLRQSVQDLGAAQLDANRFEQEIIYYLEKMDFSEEKTRLRQHCSYFLETINKEDISKGKVLGFILQEIGREINTLGAKANDAGIQQIVVLMKDELEKAKEQVLNVL